MEVSITNKNIEESNERVKNILRDAYKAHIKNGKKGYVRVDMSDDISKRVIPILSSVKLFTRTSDGYDKYRITKKGRRIFDEYYREPGEFLSLYEKLMHTLRRNKVKIIKWPKVPKTEVIKYG